MNAQLENNPNYSASSIVDNFDHYHNHHDDDNDDEDYCFRTISTRAELEVLTLPDNRDSNNDKQSTSLIFGNLDHHHNDHNDNDDDSNYCFKAISSRAKLGSLFLLPEFLIATTTAIMMMITTRTPTKRAGGKIRKQQRTNTWVEALRERNTMLTDT